MASLHTFGGAVALTVLALAPAPAQALSFDDGRVTLDVTESLVVDWHFTLDDPAVLNEADRDHVVDLRNRLNVRLRWDRFTFGMRLDTAWFPNAPQTGLGGSSQYQDDLIRPEELFVTARFGRLSVTLGDDFLTIGRGLALSLRKVDEIGFTTSLRGVHLSWRSPRVNIRASAGMTNVVNVDGVEEKLVPDPNDLVFATRIEAMPVQGLKLGAHFVDIERRHSDLRQGLVGAITGDDDDAPINNRKFIRSMIAGGSVALPSIADVVSVYAEADALIGEDRRLTAQGERVSDVNGFAFYGSLQAYVDSWTLLFEAKHYDDFEVASSLHPDTAQESGITQTFSYIIPPTLERIDQRIQNNTDVTGLRLRVDHRLGETKNSVFLSGAWFGDAPGNNEYTVHVFGGYEGIGEGGSRLLLQAGYRHEEAPDEDLVRLRMLHVDIDIFHTFSERADLQFHLQNEFRSQNPGSPLEDSYLEGSSYLTLNLPPQRLSLTLQFEYLTDQETAEPLFFGGIVQYRFTQDSSVQVFVGRSKGGLKCSGGVCRIFPNFEGVKLETTVRF